MSIYATHTDKVYRAKVPLSGNTDRVVIYRLYGHHPAGWPERFELVEIEGIDRDGNPSEVIVPYWVLRHFLSAEGENWDLDKELLGDRAAEAMKAEIRKRRGKA